MVFYPRLMPKLITLFDFIILAIVPFQLRALDWDMDGPLQNFPTVVIYHPDNGHAFANVGWAGWIASISG